MKVLTLLAASIIFALSACATDSADDSSQPSKDVQFSCDNGESLSVRFFPEQERAVLIRTGKAMELKQQPSGSGFIYSNGPNTIRGKGKELMVEIGRMLPIQCTAQ